MLPQRRRRAKIRAMYIVAIAWLYAILIIAAADDNVVGGIMTFVLGGLAPLSLFLWLFGTPARRRAAHRRAQREAGKTHDRAESGPDQ